MNSHSLYLSAALLLLGTLPAQADVMYQCVDESGHKSFSNIKPAAKSSRCIAMDMGTPATIPAPKAAEKAPTPASFPKVDGDAQRARDNDRRRILDSELAAEQKNLERAKQELVEQEGIVLPSERMQYKGGAGISGGKVEERLQTFRDKAALHQRNIEAIQREISKLR